MRTKSLNCRGTGRFTIGGLVGALMMVAMTMAMLSLQPQARAQATGVGTVNWVSADTLTNAVTWANPGNAIAIDRQTMVGLVVKFQGTSANTSNIVCTLARSADGVNFETSPPSTLSFTNAMNGTNVVVGFWQIPRDVVGSAGYLRLASVQNFHASISATNATIGIVKKKELVP